MKTFRLVATLIMVAVCVTLTSCSGDDDKNGGDLSKIIVGTWKVTAWECSEGEGGSGLIGAQYSFKKDGFADEVGITDVGKWSIRKRGETLRFDGKNIVLKDDAVVVHSFWEDGTLDDDYPFGFLIKERTSDTMSVSLLEFELSNDVDSYSRGTLKKVK